MGFGMGLLRMVQHDRKGGLKMERRPLVVMNDRAFVDLGVIQKPLWRVPGAVPVASAPAGPAGMRLTV